MSFHADLLRQANHLARLERRRPRQASLSRAVSTAYYALFHMLVDAATAVMFGQANAKRRFRHALARGFSHQSMAATCRSVAGGNLPATIDAVVAPLPIPADLRMVARTFARLQEERHRADYNRSAAFSKAEVLNLLQDATDAVAAWQRVRNDQAAQFFLMALAVWDQIRR